MTKNKTVGAAVRGGLWCAVTITTDLPATGKPDPPNARHRGGGDRFAVKHRLQRHQTADPPLSAIDRQESLFKARAQTAPASMLPGGDLSDFRTSC